MNVQPSLFARPQTAPDEGCERYEIEAAGVTVFADFNPKWMAGMAHIAFQSVSEREPNPLSETGYLSHFVWGSTEGMTDDEIRSSIQEVADGILKGA
jgi:hypothetical protein